MKQRGLIFAAVVVALLPTAAPAWSQTPGPRYVALGDSFTAGPFIPLQEPDPLGCWRSDHNYPHVLARAMGFVLRDVSCSGAETRDMHRPQTVFGGVNPPQLDALEPTADVVTVGIGGNDIGFSEILETCTSPVPMGAPCRDRYTAQGSDELSRRIADTADDVAGVLAEIRRRSPNARVLVVGYQSILPEQGPGCWPVMPITPEDVPYLRDKHKELNAMLAAQAAAGGATYVDTYGPSIGHDACALPGVRWVEPAVPMAPAAPVHPNAAGMAAVALVLQVALQR